MSPLWKGVFCALWTPTNAAGELIETELVSQIEFLKGQGLDGLMVLGSTGEFLHLSVPQRKRVIEIVAANSGPLRLIVNVSDIRPAVVADLGGFAQRNGADSVSVLPPYFYPLDQEDMLEFFVRAGEMADLPLFLYNYPERTGNRIALETVQGVAERVPLAGIKQSGEDFAYHGPLIKLGKEKGFAVFTGADTRLGEAVELGVSGCVSGLANAVPELVIEVFDLAKQSAGSSSEPAERLTELARRLAELRFPLDVAACMEARGRPVGALKPIVSGQTRARYASLVGALRKLFQQWRLV